MIAKAGKPSLARYANTDERVARQCAVLVAVAFHVFIAVWLLQRVELPRAALAPALVLVDMHEARAVPAVKPGAARSSAPHYAADMSRPAKEPRSAIVAGNTNAGDVARKSTGIHADGAASDDRGADAAGGWRTRFAAPKVLRKAPADYPASAFRLGAQGSVQVLVTIGADGSLVDARVASSSGNPALDEASLETVRHYLFKAGERDGVAAQMDAYIDIGWTITPAVIRRYASGTSVLALPAGLATKRAPTRFGSWMETAKQDAAERGE